MVVRKRTGGRNTLLQRLRKADGKLPWTGRSFLHNAPTLSTESIIEVFLFVGRTHPYLWSDEWKLNQITFSSLPNCEFPLLTDGSTITQDSLFFTPRPSQKFTDRMKPYLSTARSFNHSISQTRTFLLPIAQSELCNLGLHKESHVLLTCVRHL